MKYINKLVIILFLTIFLSGCDDKKSVDTSIYNTDETIQIPNSHTNISNSTLNITENQNSESAQVTKISWKLIKYVMD